MPFITLRAQTPRDIEAIKDLFLEYVYILGRTYQVTVGYQDFEGEMATFPDRYEALWIARVDGAPAGAVALKALEGHECEMKRLYVRDAFRGLGLGRRLCERLMADALARGYRVMRLDTHESMASARTLYGALGFTPSAPHNEPGNAGTLFFSKQL